MPRSIAQLYEEDSATVAAGVKFPTTPITLLPGTTSIIIRFTPSGNDMTLRLIETDGSTDHETTLRYQPASAPVPNGAGSEWEVASKKTTSRKVQFKVDAPGQVNMVVQSVMEA